MDLWNIEFTGEVTKTLTAQRSCPHHIPCIVVEYVDDIQSDKSERGVQTG